MINNQSLIKKVNGKEERDDSLSCCDIEFWVSIDWLLWLIPKVFSASEDNKIKNAYVHNWPVICSLPLAKMKCLPTLAPTIHRINVICLLLLWVQAPLPCMLTTTATRFLPQSKEHYANHGEVEAHTESVRHKQIHWVGHCSFFSRLSCSFFFFFLCVRVSWSSRRFHLYALRGETTSMWLSLLVSQMKSFLPSTFVLYIFYTHTATTCQNMFA